MPKMKTHRGAAKRFKKTGTARSCGRRSNKRHILTKKSQQAEAPAAQEGCARCRARRLSCAVRLMLPQRSERRESATQRRGETHAPSEARRRRKKRRQKRILDAAEGYFGARSKLHATAPRGGRARAGSTPTAIAGNASASSAGCGSRASTPPRACTGSPTAGSCTGSRRRASRSTARTWRSSQSPTRRRSGSSRDAAPNRRPRSESRAAMAAAPAEPRRLLDARRAPAIAAARSLAGARRGARALPRQEGLASRACCAASARSRPTSARASARPRTRQAADRGAAADERRAALEAARAISALRSRARLDVTLPGAARAARPPASGHAGRARRSSASSPASASRSRRAPRSRPSGTTSTRSTSRRSSGARHAGHLLRRGRPRAAHAHLAGADPRDDAGARRRSASSRPGRVYRHDRTPRHSPMFHQIEGFWSTSASRFADLKGVLYAFARHLMGADVRAALPRHFFPFTEPSAELDYCCLLCEAGCATCSQRLDRVGRLRNDPSARARATAASTPSATRASPSAWRSTAPAMLRFGIPNIQPALRGRPARAGADLMRVAARAGSRSSSSCRPAERSPSGLTHRRASRSRASSARAPISRACASATCSSASSIRTPTSSRCAASTSARASRSRSCAARRTSRPARRSRSRCSARRCPTARSSRRRRSAASSRTA